MFLTRKKKQPSKQTLYDSLLSQSRILVEGQDDEARHSLRAFTHKVFPAYQDAPHLDMIDEALELIVRDKLRRLIIEMPPRHGKSEKASVHFPPYYLGRHPNRRVIITSYSSDLSYRFSR